MVHRMEQAVKEPENMAGWEVELVKGLNALGHEMEHAYLDLNADNEKVQELFASGTTEYESTTLENGVTTDLPGERPKVVVHEVGALVVGHQLAANAMAILDLNAAESSDLNEAERERAVNRLIDRYEERIHGDKRGYLVHTETQAQVRTLAGPSEALCEAVYTAAPGGGPRRVFQDNPELLRRAHALSPKAVEERSRPPTVCAHSRGVGLP